MTNDAPDRELDRRGFLGRISIAISAGIGAVIALPPIAFLLAPVFKSPPERWRSVGRLDDFEIGKTVKVRYDDPSSLPWAGVTARTAAWLRRTGDESFVAFSVNCRHLGCPVRWIDTAKLFLCPCHGGVYYEDGSVAAGPPPAPLARYEVRVRKKHVEIRTGKLTLSS